MMHKFYLNQTENAGKHVKWSIIDYFFVFQNDDSRRPIFIFLFQKMYRRNLSFS